MGLFDEPESFDWGVKHPDASDHIAIRDLLVQQMNTEHKALDEMIERMLTAGIRAGIAVVINANVEPTFDPDATSTTISYYSERLYRLDEHVPFGHVFEFPSLQAYERWQERGHPLP